MLVSAASVIRQRQELVPRPLAIAERSQHRDRHRTGVLLLHAAHHPAEVPGLANHAHSHRVDHILNRQRHFLRDPLLNLQATRKHVYNPRNLAEADHLPLRQIGHVHLAEERQQMVFAQTEELDVLTAAPLFVLTVDIDA
jgi:hypothetical protein